MTKEELELYSHLKMQAFFREKAGPIQGDDRTWWTDENVRLFIPLTIDPVNPERGLWGMVDWGHAYARASEGDGNLLVEVWGDDLGRPRPFYGAPTIVLLKALAAQVGAKL